MQLNLIPMKRFSYLLTVLAVILLMPGWLSAQTTTCGVNANFTTTTNPNGVPTFTSISTTSAGWAITSYTWDFGDNTPFGSTPTVQHVYSQQGIYNVCLYTTAQLQGSNIFCTDTQCYTFSNCLNAVFANYTITNISGNTYTFVGTGNSNSQPLSYIWSVNGTNLSTAGPTFVYTFPSTPAATTYQVCLTVVAANGCSANSCQSITIQGTGTNPCAGANANFSTTTGNNFITALADSTISGTGLALQWWLNGQAVNNPSPNAIQQTFTNIASGVNTICLYVYANNSTVFCDSSCQTVTISPCANFQANAGADINTQAGSSVTLGGSPTASGGTGPYTYVWSPSANLSSGTIANPIANVQASTQFCVVAFDANQCSADDCVNVTIVNNPCNVSAAWTHTYVQNGGVQFTSASANTNVQHIWNFGDGNFSTSANPLHYFTAAGLYNVCHIVTVPGSACADTVCNNIQATIGTPCLGYSVSISQGTTPNGAIVLTANVSNLGSTTPSTFVWSNSASSQSITATTAGVYCVTAVNSTGCSATACDSVGSNTNPCAAFFQFAPVSGTCNTFQFTNLSSGSFTNVQWNFGDGSSSTLQNPVHTFANAGTYNVSLIIFGNNCQNAYNMTIVVQPCSSNFDTICGVVFNDTNGNGVLDNNETVITGAIVNAGNYNAITDSSGQYLLIVPYGTYTVYHCPNSASTITVPLTPATNSGVSGFCGYYYNVQVSATSPLGCGYNFGIQNNSVNICGQVFFDANNNGVLDAGSESGLQGVNVRITSSTGVVYNAYTNNAGNYCRLVPAGNYTISIVSNNFNTCSVTPASISLTTTAGQSYSNQNFAIYCQPGNGNLAINITPNTTVTPGFPAWYNMSVCNVGTSPMSGTVNFFYDAAMTFNTSTPAPASHNASTQTVSWNVNNLLPGQCQYYTVRFNALTSISIGQFVFTLANVTPATGFTDVDLTNNVDTIHQNVTGSWDPNNKLAYTTNYDNPMYQLVSSIETNQRIEYVVNFQNTGNAPAVNVVIKDELAAELDANSFEFLGSSHPCIVVRNGSEVDFQFPGIMLPDSVNDEPNSHGFVRFAINSFNGLAAGLVIADDAAIYFDFNEAVITNEAEVIMMEPSSVNDKANGPTVSIAPNPVKTHAVIRIQGENGFSLQVVDITGRTVGSYTTTNNTLTFNRNQLPSGVYTYRVVTTDNKTLNGKLVIE